MKKRRIVWPAIIVVVACGIAFLVRRSPVSQALADVAARGEPTTIDIATITSFEWDKLYIFEPYTSPERVEQYLGFRWPQASMYSVKDGKDAALFVFVKGQKVVHWGFFPGGQSKWLQARGGPIWYPVRHWKSNRLQALTISGNEPVSSRPCCGDVGL
jgi:hypothetical protein